MRRETDDGVEREMDDGVKREINDGGSRKPDDGVRRKQEDRARRGGNRGLPLQFSSVFSWVRLPESCSTMWCRQDLSGTP